MGDCSDGGDGEEGFGEQKGQGSLNRGVTRAPPGQEPVPREQPSAGLAAVHPAARFSIATVVTSQDGGMGDVGHGGEGGLGDNGDVGDGGSDDEVFKEQKGRGFLNKGVTRATPGQEYGLMEQLNDAFGSATNSDDDVVDVSDKGNGGDRSMVRVVYGEGGHGDNGDTLRQARETGGDSNVSVQNSLDRPDFGPCGTLGGQTSETNGGIGQGLSASVNTAGTRPQGGGGLPMGGLGKGPGPLADINSARDHGSVPRNSLFQHLSGGDVGLPTNSLDFASNINELSAADQVSRYFQENPGLISHDLMHLNGAPSVPFGTVSGDGPVDPVQQVTGAPSAPPPPQGGPAGSYAAAAGVRPTSQVGRGGSGDFFDTSRCSNTVYLERGSIIDNVRGLKPGDHQFAELLIDLDLRAGELRDILVHKFSNKVYLGFNTSLAADKFAAIFEKGHNWEGFSEKFSNGTVRPAILKGGRVDAKRTQLRLECVMTYFSRDEIERTLLAVDAIEEVLSVRRSTFTKKSKTGAVCEIRGTQVYCDVRVKSLEALPSFIYPYTEPGKPKEAWGLVNKLTGGGMGCYRCGDPHHHAKDCSLAPRRKNTYAPKGQRDSRPEPHDLQRLVQTGNSRCLALMRRVAELEAAQRPTTGSPVVTPDPKGDEVMAAGVGSGSGGTPVVTHDLLGSGTMTAGVGTSTELPVPAQEGILPSDPVLAPKRARTSSLDSDSDLSERPLGASLVRELGKRTRIRSPSVSLGGGSTDDAEEEMESDSLLFITEEGPPKEAAPSSPKISLILHPHPSTPTLGEKEVEEEEEEEESPLTPPFPIPVTPVQYSTCLSCGVQCAQVCRRCKSAHYCSNKCIFTHWSVHRNTCVPQSP